MLWTDEVFEMIAVEVKGRNPEFGGNVVGVYRAPNEDVRVIQGVTGGTDQTSGGCSLC